MCNQWEAESGGNTVRIFPLDGLQPTDPPPSEEDDDEDEDEDEPDAYLLECADGVELRAYQDKGSETGYTDARKEPGDVLGQVGGLPEWIQADETPNCGCGQSMRCVVQLEAHGGGGMNFGDSGSGYGFLCSSCQEGRFLWQCT